MYDKLIERLRECTAEVNCTGCDCNNSVIKQAADAIEELQAVVNGLTAQTNMVFEKTEGRTVIKFEPKWIPVTERLPESKTHVLAACRTLFSNCGYICDAFYAAPKSMEVSCYDACECETEYDEEEDKYFLVSGWYEVIKNWDDYDSIAIEDKVTHWMPLPQPPKDG